MCIVHDLLNISSWKYFNKWPHGHSIKGRVMGPLLALVCCCFMTSVVS